MKSKVSIARCADYRTGLVEDSVRKAVDLLGGIKNFIKPGSKVLVKPNILMAKEPEAGITTHPEVVRSVIRLLKEQSCKVFVGDSPSVFGNQIGNLGEVYERTGISRICKEELVELVMFDKRLWQGKFPLTSYLKECDYFISIPKFKTHNLTTLTGAIKNLFGLVCGTYKIELHKNYFDASEFAKMIVDIYEVAKPDLTIVDAIVSMEGDGPATAGTLKNTGFLVASVDCVAIDSILSVLMGLKPDEILTTREAALRGLGVSDIAEIEILGEDLAKIKPDEFLLPSASIQKRKIPKPILNIFKALVRYYPVIRHDRYTRCCACVKACPQMIISLKNNKMRFDYSRCIACFCCQEVCPSSAINVKKTILTKMLGL